MSSFQFTGKLKCGFLFCAVFFGINLNSLHINLSLHNAFDCLGLFSLTFMNITSFISHFKKYKYFVSDGTFSGCVSNGFLRSCVANRRRLPGPLKKRKGTFRLFFLSQTNVCSFLALVINFKRNNLETLDVRCF